MTDPYRLGTDPSTDRSTDSPDRIPPPTPTYIRTYRQTERERELRGNPSESNAHEEKPIHRCFEVDGARVHGDPNMSDEARAAIRELIAAVHRLACRHCGHIGAPGDDHTCPCPYPDEDCPDHPLAQEAS